MVSEVAATLFQDDKTVAQYTVLITLEGLDEKSPGLQLSSLRPSGCLIRH